MPKLIRNWCIFRIYPDIMICIWIKTKSNYHQYIISLEYRFKHRSDTEDTLSTIINIGL